MEEVLQAAIQLMPLIQKLTHGEVALAVADLKTYVAYADGKTLSFGIKIGDAILQKSGARAALDGAGELVRREMSAENYGFRYMVVARALKNADGAVAGALIAGFPLTLEDELGRMASDLASAMQQFAATFENVTEIAENSNSTASAVEQTAQNVGNALASTGTMTTGITRIADKTRLLGLNASIEAAHAGKAGAGFAVVAREIQALSDQSIKAAHEVNQMLAGLNSQTAGLTDAVDLLRADSERLRTALAQATAYVERLANMADTLQTLATRSGE